MAVKGIGRRAARASRRANRRAAEGAAKIGAEVVEEVVEAGTKAGAEVVEEVVEAGAKAGAEVVQDAAKAAPDVAKIAETIEQKAKRMKSYENFDLERKNASEIKEKFKRGRTLDETSENRRQRTINGYRKEANDVLETYEKSTGGKDMNKILARKIGVKPEELSQEAIKDHYIKKIGEEKLRDTDLGDRMIHYKIPQRAAAAGGTAWLVSSLSANKGRQSNAQLYGQQGY